MDVTKHFAIAIGSHITDDANGVNIGEVIQLGRDDIAKVRFVTAQTPSLPLSTSESIYEEGNILFRPETYQTGAITATIRKIYRYKVIAQASPGQPHSSDGDSNMVWETPTRGHAAGIHKSYDTADRSMSIIKVRPALSLVSKQSKQSKHKVSWAISDTSGQKRLRSGFK